MAKSSNVETPVKFIEGQRRHYPPHIYGRYQSRLFLQGYLLGLGIHSKMLGPRGSRLIVDDISDDNDLRHLVDAYNLHLKGDNTLLERFAMEHTLRRVNDQ